MGHRPVGNPITIVSTQRMGPELRVAAWRQTCWAGCAFARSRAQAALVNVKGGQAKSLPGCGLAAAAAVRLLCGEAALQTLDYASIDCQCLPSQPAQAEPALALLRERRAGCEF